MSHRFRTSISKVYGELQCLLESSRTPAVEQTSAFPDLPLDILYSICDELPISAKTLISRTCRVTWYMLRSECSRQLKEDRFNTLTDLGNVLPDHYHCTRCDKLHPVEASDIPDLTDWYRRHHSCHLQGQMLDHLRPHYYYAISFHHIQLALKYSRMKEKHQDCRRNTLQSFEIGPVGSPVIKTFTAKPKVVNARLILLATYVLYKGPLQDAVEEDLYRYIVFCPHQHFCVDPRSRNSLAAILQEAVMGTALCKITTPSNFPAITARQTTRWWLMTMRSSSRLGMTWGKDSLLRIPAGKVTCDWTRMRYSRIQSLTMNTGASLRCMIAAVVKLHSCGRHRGPSKWLTYDGMIYSSMRAFTLIWTRPYRPMTCQISQEGFHPVQFV